MNRNTFISLANISTSSLLWVKTDPILHIPYAAHVWPVCHIFKPISNMGQQGSSGCCCGFSGFSSLAASRILLDQFHSDRNCWKFVVKSTTWVYLRNMKSFDSHDSHSPQIVINTLADRNLQFDFSSRNVEQLKPEDLLGFQFWVMPCWMGNPNVHHHFWRIWHDFTQLFISLHVFRIAMAYAWPPVVLSWPALHWPQPCAESVGHTCDSKKALERPHGNPPRFHLGYSTRPGRQLGITFSHLNHLIIM